MYNAPYFLVFALFFATVLFLLFIVFSKTFRQHKEKLLNLSNSLILIFLFLDTLNIGLLLFTSKDVNSSIGVNYYDATRACIVTLVFLVHLLFLKKRFRKKISFTIISVLLLFVFIERDSVAMSVISFFSNYFSIDRWVRPSSWSVFYTNPFRVPVYVIGACYFLICGFVVNIQSKRGIQ